MYKDKRIYKWRVCVKIVRRLYHLCPCIAQLLVQQQICIDKSVESDSLSDDAIFFSLSEKGMEKMRKEVMFFEK